MFSFAFIMFLSEFSGAEFWVGVAWVSGVEVWAEGSLSSPTFGGRLVAFEKPWRLWIFGGWFGSGVALGSGAGLGLGFALGSWTGLCWGQLPALRWQSPAQLSR